MLGDSYGANEEWGGGTQLITSLSAASSATRPLSPHHPAPTTPQGPLLESRDLPLGIVGAIAGQTRMVVTVEGTQGHAGTVPMQQRCAWSRLVALSAGL